MRLKPRLAALAGLVPAGSVVADIGTDHAYLPIYLLWQGLAGKVIAVENRPSTLEQARRSLNLFNYQHKVDLRLGDGLGPVNRDDGVTVVVMAGLGGRSICRLLLEARWKWGWFQQLILQPMQESALLRRWLVAHGMRFVSELLVREEHRIYEIMVVQRGRQQIDDPILYELGPCLVRDGDPLLPALIQQKIRRCGAVAAALQQSGRMESMTKRAYLLEKESRLKEVLACVGEGRGYCRLS